MLIVLDSPTPYEAREAAAGALDDQHVPIVEIAKLLTSELVANAIEHGGGAERVVVAREGCEFRVEVYDDSPDCPVLVEATPEDSRGRGIFLIDRLAAHWECKLQGEKKTVSFCIELPIAS